MRSSANQEGCEVAGDLVGVVHDAVAGEPRDAVAGDLQLYVSAAVVLKPPLGLMRVPAVDLDHGIVLRPVGVHERALDKLVEQGPRKAGAFGELEERVLEFGLGP